MYRSEGELYITKDQYYRFYINDFIEGGDVRLSFSKEGHFPPYLTIDWNIDKLIINGEETTEYEIDRAGVWTMKFVAPEHSKIEFYMQAKDTFEEDQGLAIVNYLG